MRATSAEDTRLFWRQMAVVGCEVKPGPGKLLRWGVADARLHYDLVLSLELVGELDAVDWWPRVAGGISCASFAIAYR